MLGTTFSVKDKALIETVENREIRNLLQNEFKIGDLAEIIAGDEALNKDMDGSISMMLSLCCQNFNAEFTTGYWSDHFVYLLDLIESYRMIFPENLTKLLYEDNSYRYFYSPVYIEPNEEKCVLRADGQVRRYGAINEKQISEIVRTTGAKVWGTNWAKDKNGTVYQTSLASKLINLILIKLSCLDPHGIGVDMESEKPGWNDAMNGMPGIFGSSVGEAMELLLSVNFLMGAFSGEDREIRLLTEQYELLTKIEALLSDGADTKTFYKEATAAKEAFRAKVKYFVSGEETTVRTKRLAEFLGKAKEKLETGIQKAKEIGNGLYPTFLSYEAAQYETVKNEDGSLQKTHYGLPKVIVDEFTVRALPLFAEAVAKSYKLPGVDARQTYEAVKETDLFDKTLKVYKTSVSLDEEGFEIGRIRSFVPGWLERESCFLHMDYKYLYGILRAGLYESYYEELKTNLVPFKNPEQYGRSILENSSFIVTDNHRNKDNLGRGFQPRLTGANAEILSMWSIMMFGDKVFSVQDNKLAFTLEPKLAAEFFDENNEVTFTFLSKIKVTYQNDSRKNTFDSDAAIPEIRLYQKDKLIKTEQNPILGETALQIRNGEFDRIVAIIE